MRARRPGGGHGRTASTPARTASMPASGNSTRTRPPPNNAIRTATLSRGAWSAKIAKTAGEGALGNAHRIARPEPRLLSELDQSIALTPLEFGDDRIGDTGGAVPSRTSRITPGL